MCMCLCACICTCEERQTYHQNHTSAWSYFCLHLFVRQIFSRLPLHYKVQDVLPAVFPIKEQKHTTELVFELMFLFFNKIVIDRVVFTSFLSVVSESIFFQSIFSMLLLPHHLAQCQIAVGSIQFCLLK